jgi:hypothetical protein
MKISRLTMYAASAVAAAGILAGCTGNALQSTPANPSAFNSSFKDGHLVPLTAMHAVAGAHVSQRGNWVSPDKKKKGSLVYISDYGAGVVYFYNYTPGKIGSEAGSISSGISGPQGLCSDKKGDVYIANTDDSNVLEYAHGSTTLKNTLSATGEYPVGCAVSTKGNLAVTNIASTSGGEGNVLVFTKAKGTPKSYTCGDLDRYFFPAYDKKGNLYVDGLDASGAFAMCELPKGSDAMENLNVSSPAEFPGGVSWDGKYVAVNDQEEARIDQYSISGTTATLAGTVSLNGASDVDQDTVAGGYVIGPDAGDATVELWNYPAGGSIIDSLGGFSEPIGSTVSK